MNKPPKIELEDDELIEEMEKLEDAVRASVVPPYKQMFRSFLNGISSAVGVLVAGAIIIPLAIYLLRNVEWIPLIGRFVDQVTQYTQGNKT